MMKLVYWFTVAVLGTVFSSAESSKVIELTVSNFDELVGEGDWLVEFYAPWCGHCRQFAPTYEEIANELHGKVRVGKIDATQQVPLRERFPVRGYPTIFSVQNKQVRQYSGRRSKAAVIKFAQSSDERELSFFESPFGPVGKMKGTIAKTITDVKFIQERIVKDFQLTEWQAWSAVGAIASIAFLVFVITLSLLFAPSQTPRPHEHTD